MKIRRGVTPAKGECQFGFRLTAPETSEQPHSGSKGRARSRLTLVPNEQTGNLKYSQHGQFCDHSRDLNYFRIGRDWPSIRRPAQQDHINIQVSRPEAFASAFSGTRSE